MTKEIKKIGSNIEVKGIIIHQVVKEAGIRIAVPRLAKKELKIEDKERIFIAKINKSYFGNSGPTYGIFADENPDFKTELKNYLEHNDFYKFSVNALGHYKSIVQDTVAATGGFVIFAHYYNSEKKFDYMLVMTINNKDGFVVNEDLEIKDIKNLDLSKVDVACVINLTKWTEIEQGIDSDSQTYLSFAKGNKKVTHYFLSFIDCDNKTTSTESTNRMKRALNDYCDSMDLDREAKIKKKNEVYNYCIDCMSSNREIQLSGISSLLDPENPDSFAEFAGTEDYGVSPVINGDKSKLKTMKFATYKGSQLTVEFDLELITQKKVVYDKIKNQLTIKNIPQQLIDQIPD